MNQEAIENIVSGLFKAIPVIHRKLTSVLDEGVSPGLSHYHFAILGILSKSGALPVSEIARQLIISRPQMTAEITKLEALNLVSRAIDPSDRRVIQVSLTPEGLETLNRARALIRKNVENKLASLSEGDIRLLSEALTNIHIIGTKIE